MVRVVDALARDIDQIRTVRHLQPVCTSEAEQIHLEVTMVGMPMDHRSMQYGSSATSA